MLGDYLFLSFIFFQLKSGSKTDLCLYDFVCLHILFNICLCESDVSKGCETQNKNSVCRHFKLDLESKLKNTTAWSARARRTQIKIKAYYCTQLLNKCASFVLGGGAILVLHAVGVIESSLVHGLLFFFVAADKTIKISAKRRRFHYVLYRFVCLTVLFTYFLSLYH